jgi:hypothetical protein
LSSLRNSSILVFQDGGVLALERLTDFDSQAPHTPWPNKAAGLGGLALVLTCAWLSGARRRTAPPGWWRRHPARALATRAVFFEKGLIVAEGPVADIAQRFAWEIPLDLSAAEGCLPDRPAAEQ